MRLSVQTIGDKRETLWPGYTAKEALIANWLGQSSEMECLPYEKQTIIYHPKSPNSTQGSRWIHNYVMRRWLWSEFNKKQTAYRS